MPWWCTGQRAKAREECWHVSYGDVRVGTIAIRSRGERMPHDWKPTNAGDHRTIKVGSHISDCPTKDLLRPRPLNVFRTLHSIHNRFADFLANLES